MNDAGLFNMYLQQAGGSMLTADGTKTNFNNAAGLRVLDFWDRMINKNRVYELGFGRRGFVPGLCSSCAFGSLNGASATHGLRPQSLEGIAVDACSEGGPNRTTPHHSR